MDCGPVFKALAGSNVTGGGSERAPVNEVITVFFLGDFGESWAFTVRVGGPGGAVFVVDAVDADELNEIVGISRSRAAKLDCFSSVGEFAGRPLEDLGSGRDFELAVEGGDVVGEDESFPRSKGDGLKGGKFVFNSVGESPGGVGVDVEKSYPLIADIEKLKVFGVSIASGVIHDFGNDDGSDSWGRVSGVRGW